MTDYDGSASQYTLTAGSTIGTLTMTVGHSYTLKYKAKNAVGFSEDSIFTYVALARPSDRPPAPTFDHEASTRVMNVVKWSQGTSVDIPVSGYRLYSDNGLPGNSFLIYNGEGRT